MKKAIVMEKHRQYTIVMTKDGEFQKAKPVKNAVVGAEVSYELFKGKEQLLFFFHPRKVNKSFRLIAMACLLLLIVMPFSFVSNSNKTYAYVNVDINPSVELEVDEDLKVHSILPLNDDAKKLVDGLADYKNEPLGEVLSRIMDKSEEKGLIKNGKNVLVGVSYVNDKTRKISVLETIDSYFLDHQTDWKTATFRVPKEIRENAKEKETSMNKLMAKSLVEKNKLDDNEADSSKQDRMNNEEKAIINSFYNDDKTKKAKAVQPEKKPAKSENEEVSYQTNNHRSEIQEKKGSIHFNHNHNHNEKKANKNKSNVAKEKHKKANHAKKNNGKAKHKNKDKHKDKYKDKHKHAKGKKHKHEEKKHDNGKHKDKHKRNKGHGQGHDKHKNKHN